MYEYIKASHDTEKYEIRNKIEQAIVNLVKSKVEEKAQQGGIKWEKAEQKNLGKVQELGQIFVVV